MWPSPFPITLSGVGASRAGRRAPGAGDLSPRRETSWRATAQTIGAGHREAVALSAAGAESIRTRTRRDAVGRARQATEISGHHNQKQPNYCFCSFNNS